MDSVPVVICLGRRVVWVFLVYRFTLVCVPIHTRLCTDSHSFPLCVFLFLLTDSSGTTTCEAADLDVNSKMLLMLEAWTRQAVSTHRGEEPAQQTKLQQAAVLLIQILH